VGLAGNWTDQLEVPEETGAVARFGFGPDWEMTLEVRIDALEPGRRVEWTPVGGFPGWIGTTIAWELEPAEDGGTIVQFSHRGWPDEAADGEMARCGYTWAMIIDRLAGQVGRGEHAPYFVAAPS
jgi:Activator of Hsp90 ATPase homolog 1-like protein